MRTAVVIEIAAAAHDQLPVQLLEVAYRASASGPVALVVPRGARPVVDRALDPVVASVGLDVDGIRYIARHDVEGIRTALLSCAWAVAATSEFRSLCASMNVPVLASGAAVDALSRPARPRSVVALALEDREDGQALAS